MILILAEEINRTQTLQSLETEKMLSVVSSS